MKLPRKMSNGWAWARAALQGGGDVMHRGALRERDGLTFGKCL